MAAKHPQGNDIYDLLINLILNLSPTQALKVYNELQPRFDRQKGTVLYNDNGEEDKDGLVRLTKYQYKAIRTKFGDSYVKKSFTELSNYIRFLEEHLNEKPVYKQQLKKYKSGTHNLELTKGWVYNKCKQYVMTEPIKLNVNPFMIEDYATAKAYIKSLPESMRQCLDVKALLLKFPQLASENFEEE